MGIIAPSGRIYCNVHPGGGMLGDSAWLKDFYGTGQRKWNKFDSVDEAKTWKSLPYGSTPSR